MYTLEEARARLSALDRPAGPAARELTLAFATIRLEGLTEGAASLLDGRWGGFVGPGTTTPSLVVRVMRGDGTAWLPRWQPGEGYRIEADASAGSLLARSYHFALEWDGGARWRLAIEDTDAEPLGRVFDNVARYLVARLAIERGGLALHAAGVRRGGRAWIFAGPSGAGKSTAVRRSAPAESLGDDFAVVIPDGDGHATCALPFDNAERAPRHPVAGLVPVGAVCRLFQAPAHRVEPIEGARAQASLLACAAFPWALPDLEERAGDAIARFTDTGRFVHLHIADDAEFWTLIEGLA